MMDFMTDLLQIRRHKVHKFQSKIEIFQDRGPFILKTISTTDELIAALRLRYQVFHREMIGKTKATGVDVDEFDFICDHLIIIEKKSNTIIGTYRLNCSGFSQNFYSANEFSLRRILEQPGRKIELGRACIEKNFRKGLVISLLWRGIAEYMQKTNAELLFGCASIKVTDPRQAALLYRHFEQRNLISSEFLAPPTHRYTMPGLNSWIQTLQRDLTEAEQTEVEELIPPLCRAYLKIGAVLGGQPAWDEEFKCIDFLTILRRENLNRALWRKYSQCETPEPISPAEPPTTSTIQTQFGSPAAAI